METSVRRPRAGCCTRMMIGAPGRWCGCSAGRARKSLSEPRDVRIRHTGRRRMQGGAVSNGRAGRGRQECRHRSEAGRLFFISRATRCDQIWSPPHMPLLVAASVAHGGQYPLVPEPHSNCNVRASDPMRIAVLVFGGACPLEHTVDSMNQHMFAPLRYVGKVDTFVHCLRASRSGNATELSSPQEEAQRLSPCQVVMEDANAIDEEFKIQGQL